MRLDVDRFLTDLTGRYATGYSEAVSAMLVAKFQQNKPAAAQARKDLNRVMLSTLGVAEAIGAAGVLQKTAKDLASETPLRPQVMQVSTHLAFAAEPAQRLIPRVTLTEALEDLVGRTPVTIRSSARRTAQRIAELYKESPRVIAFVNSAEKAVTDRAQALISESFGKGLGEVGAGRQIKMSVNEIRERTGAWSESYSRLTFRNNVNGAVTAGRFRQVRDQDIAEVIPAMQFLSQDDGDVRHNHQAANRRIWRTTNKVWNFLAPPLGHNCRCETAMISWLDLERLGLVTGPGMFRESSIPRNAGPDQGFASQPFALGGLQ